MREGLQLPLCNGTAGQHEYSEDKESVVTQYSTMPKQGQDKITRSRITHVTNNPHEYHNRHSTFDPETRVLIHSTLSHLPTIFHKVYHPGRQQYCTSILSKITLLVTPNIVSLERSRRDVSLDRRTRWAAQDFARGEIEREKVYRPGVIHIENYGTRQRFPTCNFGGP